uniref:Phospholipase A-2-activating protein n=1 Tax=Heterorhabditis bacteriophora TaxID=37862 RepID=A0A1I7WWF6_HETBA
MEDIEMAEEEKPFILSRVITAHKADVKSVNSTSAGVIISGSRDETVKFWTKRGGEFNESVCFTQPKGLVVNSVGYYESEEGWRLFVGRKDGSISVYASGSLEPLTVLTQHSSNVWALATIENTPGYYLSGSADKTIKLWRDDNEIRTFTGHTDVIRALLVISTVRFLSAANDATIRLWHLETGICLASFSSLLDEFIFSLSFVGSYVISCGEGGYVEVWRKEKEGEELSLCHHQILHSPAQTSWSTSGLPNGDFVVGGRYISNFIFNLYFDMVFGYSLNHHVKFSDGRIYVWTQDNKRKADPTLITIFDNELAAKVAKELERKEQKENEVVVIKVSLDDGAPNMELRYQKGTDPLIAAEKFIKDNNLPPSYIIEIIEYIKANVPEARAVTNKKHQPLPTQKVVVDGKEYDYGFEVTVDDGRRLMLPYNAGEDPDWAAQQFCEKHNLPMKFLAKVVGVIFLVKLALDTQILGEILIRALGGFYKSGSAFGGLIPNSCLVNDKKRPRGELVPVNEYFKFGVEQLSQKAISKLAEVNNRQEALKLNTNQMSALEQLMASVPGSSEITDIVMLALDTGLQWKMDDIVPILDLFRIALLHEPLNKYYCDTNTRGSDTLQRLIALLISEPSDAIRILVCRTITNAFSHEYGREMLMHDLESIIPLVTKEFLGGKPALQLAAASALANWSHLLLIRSESVAELGPREDVIRGVIKVLEAVESFGDRSELALIRILQAIVTLMWGDTAVITLAKSRNMMAIVNRIKDAVVDDRESSYRTISAIYLFFAKFARSLSSSLARFHEHSNCQPRKANIVTLLGEREMNCAMSLTRTSEALSMVHMLVQSDTRQYVPCEMFRLRGKAQFEDRRIIIPSGREVVNTDNLETFDMHGIESTEKVVSTMTIDGTHSDPVCFETPIERISLAICLDVHLRNV